MQEKYISYWMDFSNLKRIKARFAEAGFDI